MEVGATVRVKGLRSKPKLNGQDGLLLDCDSCGRWTVQLNDGDTAQLQEKFLEFRAPPAPPAPPRERSPSPETIEEPSADYFSPEEQSYFQPGRVLLEGSLPPAAGSGWAAEPFVAEEQSYFQPGRVLLEGSLPPAAGSGWAAEPFVAEDFSAAGAASSVDDAPVRTSVSSRRRNLWAQPRPNVPEPPPEPAEVQEPPRVAASSSKAAVGGANAKARKMEAKLDNHLAALQAMMAEEEKKRERLMRQREAAPVVLGVGELLESLDKAEEEEEEEEEEEVVDAGQATGSSSRGGASAALTAPSNAPRTFGPSDPTVPDIGQLLAELDSQEKAHVDTPSLDNVLASIDQDEDEASARDLFLMLGSGAEPDRDKPTDPLAKMVQLSSTFNPADLIPTKTGTPSEEERKPQLTMVPRKAKWRTDDPRPEPNYVMAPVMDHLVGEGPLFGGGG